MTPKLIIFDCDGDLIDSEVISCAVEADVLSAEGYEVSAQEVAERFMGRPAKVMVEMVEDALGRKLPDDFLEKLDTKIIRAYRDRLNAVEGVADTVRSLETPYCVASSSAPAKLFTGLVEAGLVELFYPNIFSTVLVKNGKPDPDLFLHAADRMGVDPRHAVVVEDSPAGVKAALRAGMEVIGFVGGKHAGPEHASTLRKAGATTILTRFADLPRELAALQDAAAA